MKMAPITVISLVLWLTPIQAAELTLMPVPVAPGVYAVIGDLGGQTYENEGLNNNLGFVVSEDGVLVINTGPTARVAHALHDAIKKVTDRPVKWAVNVNSQNHYWHGNSYFKALGATIIAHKEADRVMREMGAGQFDANKTLLKEKAEGTVPAYPVEIFDGRRELKLGKTVLQLLHFGPAHTPGDIVVWLPRQKVVFAGDIVYTERMLAIIPISHTGGWLQAFDKLAALKPRVVVPGHGQPTDLKRAKKDTRNYLAYVRASVKKVLDDGGSLQDAVDKTDQLKFNYLTNFNLLAGRNVNQVYLEMEKEAF